MQETRVQSLGQEDPLGKWQPTPVFLPRESIGQRRLVGYSPWGLKESDITEQLSTAQHRKQTKFLAYNALRLACNNLLKRRQMH